MSDTVLQVKNLSKRYCGKLKHSLAYGIEDIARECIGMSPRSGLRLEEFWANNKISFELKKGECLGLIGGNGAGKSTLLKQIAGLIKPDAGEVEIQGQVGALIELGAGFNPILSGRENIYINGAVLGMGKKEVDRKLDRILDFADIGNFIEAPVQSYSSGMKVRLGFAVAAHLEPEILLVDEVLAVGDTQFRMKCFRKMFELINSGMSIILVSHNLISLRRIVNRCLVLNRGEIDFCGPSEQGFNIYQKSITKNPIQGSLSTKSPFTIEEVKLKTDKIRTFGTLKMYVSIRSSSDQELNNGRLVAALSNSECGLLSSISSATSGSINLPSKERATIEIIIEELPLLTGLFRFDFWLYGEAIDDLLASNSNGCYFSMENIKEGLFGMGDSHTIKLKNRWGGDLVPKHELKNQVMEEHK
ncbi:ABC transporter ATP-binding protein [Puniceicoccaceae bacterium K14]|nr:ABC transporter ATP-binding protein [Puniceicoccaceae bacterium K14]